MINENGKIIQSGNYMKRDNIGEDLFLKNQVIINVDTEEWLKLAFKSNVFYKLLLSEGHLYHPGKFINFQVVNF
ncbi:hypothetical protein AB2T96_02410 [Clostridium butyricum]|uniref:Uncharacterized protein n=1 Tax=Clostridium butyricum TaxID=1492 RepID=A0A2S7F8F5_CLOBU|nr:hypothetical protein [Clostridium butyricum]APF24712.1 hypothetical protein NPD4_1619 [Clostridium butyricum]KHD16658.1 hypothetical protein OA81_03270 [Clostridium butyricum]MBZ0311446.1 hypothetical protein [Clostridium butyricum]MDB2150725.1 hypothetical protein [Clostridium butyricum]PPV13584.1 hypothetical protein AWN73_03360 [Clostridium butyricum]